MRGEFVTESMYQGQYSMLTLRFCLCMCTSWTSSNRTKHKITMVGQTQPGWYRASPHPRVEHPQGGAGWEDRHQGQAMPQTSVAYYLVTGQGGCGFEKKSIFCRRVVVVVVILIRRLWCGAVWVRNLYGCITCSCVV